MVVGPPLWDAAADATAGPLYDTSNATVSVIIPCLNEERLIAHTVRHVREQLHPAPCEVIVVDGGSSDGTVKAAERAGAKVVRASRRGRGLQMNQGAQAASGELLMFLHADTELPADAVTQVRQALAHPRTVLVGFRPLILDGDKPMWFSTANNFGKTWYGPILMRPLSWLRGLRCLFGDQAMTVRAADFAAAGRFREDIPIMEDAELCIALHMAGPADKARHRGRGRVRMLLDSPARTSGRRIAAWGEARANGIFALISILWLAGAPPRELQRVYRRLYTDVR
ncbi:hypothetical protein HYH03_000091 [Edaphochlamys debaryana]|uniref:Glycosyltransferase 2-like domain-containing protein n=1 Tax=Edaphochlamys debaryana TaxID=47281 RepID=A0A835YFH2_9CHLO|nr:hypothetical protein HYH03_000091 [Edaphochlamys debaryana]|eukprot:KAG2501586.1 hypothetical protein HYH03_000091 [Edaphochlamys debaryana]